MDIPDNISKTTAGIITILVVLSGAIGYAFGLDKGYATGLADGGQRPIQTQPMQAP